MSTPKYSELQGVRITFEGHVFTLRVGPPGSAEHAIAAVITIVRKRGQNDLAKRMVDNNELFTFRWGQRHLTKKGLKEQEELRRLQEIEENLRQPQTKIIFPPGPITHSEMLLRRKRRPATSRR